MKFHKRSFTAMSNPTTTTVSEVLGNEEAFSATSAISRDDINRGDLEPMSIVTPSPKRLKRNDFIHSFFDPVQNGVGFQQHQRDNSFLLDFITSNCSNINQQQGNFSQTYGDEKSFPPLNASMSSALSSSSFFDQEALSVPQERMYEDFEPLLVNPSAQETISLNVSQSCDTDRQLFPDLYNSLSSAPSSSADNGHYIIGTSDSFKGNNYAKAAVVLASTAHLNYSTPHTAEDQYEGIFNTHTPPPCRSMPSTASAPPIRFKPFHEEKWNYHYEELLAFKEENGHVLVPHTYPAKPHLARWVKRQRRQYKLYIGGDKKSTMTEGRINILNEIGFVWDSHEVIWNERFNQLVSYRQQFGHCRVPSYCKECPQLASWVKCQRRQYKLFWQDGKGSSMTLNRIKMLKSVGFVWEVHHGSKLKDSEKNFQHLANIFMEGV